MTDFIRGRDAATWLDTIIRRWHAQRLYIVSPFITKAGLSKTSSALGQDVLRKAIVLTNLDCVAIAMGSLDAMELSVLVVEFGSRSECCIYRSSMPKSSCLTVQKPVWVALTSRWEECTTTSKSAYSALNNAI